MVRRARAPGLAVALALGSLAAPAPAAAVEAVGEVYLTFTNDDADAERWSGELSWFEPLTSWLKGEIGGSYARFEGARWGYGTLGAHLTLPGKRDYLSLSWEQGAGRGERGRYDHSIGRADWTHAFVRDQVFVIAGLRRIRVDHISENLARVGLGLAPLPWLELQADYHHSVFGGEGTQAWSARTDLSFARSTLFGGYGRSEDTVDLRSIGGSRNTGRPTHQVFLGIELPVGRHALRLAGTRYESRFDTRYSLSVTWRWNLFLRPSAGDEADTPRRGDGSRAYARRQDPGGA